VTTARHLSPPEAVWRPEDVTAPWLTGALRRVGVLRGGAVKSFWIEPVGTGQMGDCVRIHLELSPGTASGPPTVVGKFTAADDQSRTTGVSMRTAEVEVRFYQQVAPTLTASVPTCLFGDVDPATARFVLLLEDLAPRVPGDQVTGCTVDQAALALEALAGVHARRWGDAALARLEWLNRRDDAATETLSAVFPVLFDGFVARYADQLDDMVVRVGERFFGRIGEYFRRRPGPGTVQHADYRVDNLLFGGPPDTPLAIVDWQTVTYGPGAADVSYFLGGSLEVRDRRRHEDGLLRQYLEVLAARGVNDFGYDELWTDYRRHAYAGLAMAVGAAMMVQRTDRGDQMFLAMAHRHAAHIEDMDAETLLGG
jgi:aminoglycoside/choline kinase family phosphotransferase